MYRQEEPPSQRRSSSGRTVDARQLWSGGAATAAVAALIALVGILVCRWLFNIPVLAPRQDGAWGDASTAGYAIAAAVAALVATAIMHLLLIGTPRPRMFFTWIIGLATVVAAVAPFGTNGSTESKVATAVINLVVGIAVGALLSGVARTAMREPPDPPRETRRVQRPVGLQPLDDGAAGCPGRGGCVRRGHGYFLNE